VKKINEYLKIILLISPLNLLSFPPYDIDDSLVFGGIPKSIFETQVLFDNAVSSFGALKDTILKFDGINSNTSPFFYRDFRRYVFVFEKARLNTSVFQGYISYLETCSKVVWENYSTNTRLLMTADIRFEHMEGSLNTNQYIYNVMDSIDTIGNYFLKPGVIDLPTNCSNFLAVA